MYRKSAKELHEAFVAKTLSATEIIHYFLKRIHACDPKLQAMIAVFDEKAKEKARILDEKRSQNLPLGRLAGVPVILKDNMNIRGEMTTCGSNFLKNYKAPFDATITTLLEKEDAIILGKSNLDEFAMGSSTEYSSFFPTKNPWDLSLVPGGSSGGSAAAVAARLAPIAFGSDTGGSIRQPASLCGIIGFKPSYGRVSRFGLVAFASSLDQIGPFATTIEDTAMIMEVLGTHCTHDATSLNIPAEKHTDKLSGSIKGWKIGVPWQFLKNLSEEYLAIFNKSIEVLKDLGAEIVDIDLDILKYSIAVYYIVATAEASTNLARFDGIRYGARSPHAKTIEEVYDLSRDEGFGAEVKRRILLGTYVLSSGYQDAFYKKAQKVRTLMIDAYNNAFQSCDLVAIPTSATSAFKLGAVQDAFQMYLQDLFTISANLTGVPAINVPGGFNKDGLPFGFQLQGPHLQDSKVLQAAYAMEKATPNHQKIPPLFDKELSI